MLFASILLAVAAMGWAHMAPVMDCTSPTPSTTTRMSCTAAYRQWGPPQIPPTSTYYDMIVTHQLNIIDCRYCTIQTFGENSAATGPFTASTRLPALDVTQLGCMVASSAITRRDFRGYDTIDSVNPTEEATPEKRSTSLFDDLVAAGVDQPMSEASIDDLATLLTANVDPGNPNLKLQAAIYVKQLVTALFGIDICNSGFDLSTLCDQSRRPDVRYRLGTVNYNPEQFSNILCFCSVYGLPLNANNDEVHKQLTDSIYALQSASEPNADVSHLCDTVSIPYGPALQIDNSGIKSYVCTNGTSINSSFAVVPPMATASSETIVSAGTISSFISGESGTWTNSTSWTIVATGTGTGFAMSTDEAGVWSNSSTWSQLGTGTVTGNGTGFPAASGKPGPWVNSTGNDNGNWSDASGTISGSWTAGATGSFSVGSGSNETAVVGTRPQGGSWASGWTASEGGWGAGGTGAVGTITGNGGWSTEVSWTATDGVQQTATGGVWGTIGHWTSEEGTGLPTGWGWNASATAGPTGDVWTATGGSTGQTTGWGFNATFVEGPGPAMSGWETGESWTATDGRRGTGASSTATGGSWATGGAGGDSNATFTFTLGTATFKTVVGTGTASDIWSVVLENTTTITVQNATHQPGVPSAPIGYPSWTTTILSEPSLMP